MSGAREHEARTADGVRIALHRLDPGGGAGRPPVLLVAGTFSNRVFWLGTRGQGFGPALAAAGYDVWVMEPRGHGRSDRPARWLLSDWVEHDAPAAVRRVLEATGASRVWWVGHSAGGVVGAAFLGGGHLLSHRVAGLVMLGAPGPGGLRGPRRWAAAAGWAAAAAAPGARLPGRMLGLGPEHEPGTLVREWLGWNVRGAWRDPRGGDYLAGLAAARLPVLAVAGAGDRLLAPPDAVRDLLDRFGGDDRTLLVAGRRHGFGEDYDHAGLVIGGGARREIWPRVLAWLGRRTGGEPLTSLEPETRERA